MLPQTVPLSIAPASRVKDVSASELEEFRAVCQAHIAMGGEAAEVAREMLRINEGFDDLFAKANAFLRS